ncbi:hypothetical protein B7463_g7597, partial [Scytalidium lignicola]
MDPAKKLLQETCHELNELPSGWKWSVKNGGLRQIYFTNKALNKTTYHHPKHGALPHGWILQLHEAPGVIPQVQYYNTIHKHRTSRNPRLHNPFKHGQVDPQASVLAIASQSSRARANTILASGHREGIKPYNIRSEFIKVRTIDVGDGTLGGMNGGVFIVRMKGVEKRLFVEKRFKSEIEESKELAENEIRILHKLKHGSLTLYVASFITQNPWDASVWVEFCDRGSLEDVINTYKKRPNERVPEGFVWHALIGLFDGLAFMQHGTGYVSDIGTVVD